MAKHLITEVVIEEDKAVVYVKKNGNGISTDDVIIETLDAHYEVESLRNLDDYNTIRCGRHVKNYALQNVSIIKYLTGGRNAGKNFKIF